MTISWASRGVEGDIGIDTTTKRLPTHCLCVIIWTYTLVVLLEIVQLEALSLFAGISLLSGQGGSGAVLVCRSISSA
jgi:hypothetical protein